MKPAALDLRAVARGYVDRMVRSVDGLKALLLDADTAGMIGVVEPQSSLLEKSVFLIELLDKQSQATALQVDPPDARTPLNSSFGVLHAIIFARPTAENVLAVRRQLQATPGPRFGSYSFFASSLLRRTYIEELAEADVHSHAVQGVQEFFLDFYAIAPHLFSFDVSPLHDINALRSSQLNPHFERTFEGIVALLLAVKKRPIVRFQRSSDLCRNLAERLIVRMDQESSLFGFSGAQSDSVNPPVLLLLDRFEDPVTPLLNQWTYEAMINERMGLDNNRLVLDRPDAKKEELVLDADIDPFYRSTRYSNFGELGVALKEYVDSFAESTKTQGMVQSIEDMLRFVDNYPEFRKSSHNVTKHVTLTGELSRLVDRDMLLEISQLEQDLACREAEAEHRKQMLSIMGNPRITPHDRIRLVILYTLRYETHEDRSGIRQVKDRLLQFGASTEELQIISSVLAYAGAARRSCDVFSNKTFYARAKNTVRRGIGGIDNVYTQHEPLLVTTLDEALRGQLPLREFPVMSTGTSENSETAIPSTLVAFMAGGLTFEESRSVAAINGRDESLPFNRLAEGTSTASAAAAVRMNGSQVILGGSCVHNSKSFLNEARQVAAHLGR